MSRYRLKQSDESLELQRGELLLPAKPGLPSNPSSRDVVQVLEGKSFFLFEPENRFRIACHKLTSSSWFSIFIHTCILLNTLCLALSTPTDPDGPFQKALDLIDDIMLVVFIVELVLRMIVSGAILGENSFLQSSGFNRLDFIVVFGSILTFFFSSSVKLNVLRAARSLRPLRAVRRLSGIRAILDSVILSIPLLVNVVSFLIFFFLVFGIIGLAFYKDSFSRRCVVTLTGETSLPTRFCKPLTSSFGYHCAEGQTCAVFGNPENGIISFDNIGSAFLLLLQTVSLDTWTSYLHALMESEVSFLSVAFFTISIIMITFIVLNLFVAVINAVFSRIRRDGKRSAFVQISDQRRKFDSGIFTKILGQKQDSIVIRNQEIESLRRGEIRGVRRAWLVTRQYLESWVLSEQFEVVMAAVIAVNVVMMATEHEGMTAYHESVLNVADTVFACIFSVEAALKIIGLRGIRQYFHDGFNQFDFIIVVATVISMVLDGSNISFLRACRVARLIRLLRRFPNLQRLLSSALSGIIPLLNLLTLIIFSLIVFACLAMQLFGSHTIEGSGVTRIRFDTFPHAVLTLFGVLSGDAWSSVMYESMTDANPVVSPIFFVSFFLFSNYILLNLFTAVILENFEMDEEEKKQKQVELFEESLRRSAENDSGNSRYAQWEKRFLQFTSLVRSSGLFSALFSKSPPRNAPSSINAAQAVAFVKQTMGDNHNQFVSDLPTVESFRSSSQVLIDAKKAGQQQEEREAQQEEYSWTGSEDYSEDEGAIEVRQYDDDERLDEDAELDQQQQQQEQQQQQQQLEEQRDLSAVNEEQLEVEILEPQAPDVIKGEEAKESVECIAASPEIPAAPSPPSPPPSSPSFSLISSLSPESSQAPAANLIEPVSSPSVPSSSPFPIIPPSSFVLSNIPSSLLDDFSDDDESEQDQSSSSASASPVLITKSDPVKPFSSLLASIPVSVSMDMDEDALETPRATSMGISNSLLVNLADLQDSDDDDVYTDSDGTDQDGDADENEDEDEEDVPIPTSRFPVQLHETILRRKPHHDQIPVIEIPAPAPAVNLPAAVLKQHTSSLLSPVPLVLAEDQGDLSDSSDEGVFASPPRSLSRLNSMSPPAFVPKIDLARVSSNLLLNSINAERRPSGLEDPPLLSRAPSTPRGGSSHLVAQQILASSPRPPLPPLPPSRESLILSTFEQRSPRVRSPDTPAASVAADATKQVPNPVASGAPVLERSSSRPLHVEIPAPLEALTPATLLSASPSSSSAAEPSVAVPKQVEPEALSTQPSLKPVVSPSSASPPSLLAVPTFSSSPSPFLGQASSPKLSPRNFLQISSSKVALESRIAAIPAPAVMTVAKPLQQSASDGASSPIRVSPRPPSPQKIPSPPLPVPGKRSSSPSSSSPTLGASVAPSPSKANSRSSKITFAEVVSRVMSSRRQQQAAAAGNQNVLEAPPAAASASTSSPRRQQATRPPPAPGNRFAEVVSAVLAQHRAKMGGAPRQRSPKSQQQQQQQQSQRPTQPVGILKQSTILSPLSGIPGMPGPRSPRMSPRVSPRVDSPSASSPNGERKRRLRFSDVVTKVLTETREHETMVAQPAGRGSRFSAIAARVMQQVQDRRQNADGSMADDPNGQNDFGMAKKKTFQDVVVKVISENLKGDHGLPAHFPRTSSSKASSKLSSDNRMHFADVVSAVIRKMHEEKAASPPAPFPQPLLSSSSQGQSPSPNSNGSAPMTPSLSATPSPRISPDSSAVSSPHLSTIASPQNLRMSPRPSPNPSPRTSISSGSSQPEPSQKYLTLSTLREIHHAFQTSPSTSPRKPSPRVPTPIVQPRVPSPTSSNDRKPSPSPSPSAVVVGAPSSSASPSHPPNWKILSKTDLKKMPAIRVLSPSSSSLATLAITSPPVPRSSNETIRIARPSASRSPSGSPAAPLPIALANSSSRSSVPLISVRSVSGRDIKASSPQSSKSSSPPTPSNSLSPTAPSPLATFPPSSSSPKPVFLPNTPLQAKKKPSNIISVVSPPMVHASSSSSVTRKSDASSGSSRSRSVSPSPSIAASSTPAPAVIPQPEQQQQQQEQQEKPPARRNPPTSPAIFKLLQKTLKAAGGSTVVVKGAQKVAEIVQRNQEQQASTPAPAPVPSPTSLLAPGDLFVKDSSFASYSSSASTATSSGVSDDAQFRASPPSAVAALAIADAKAQKQKQQKKQDALQVITRSDSATSSNLSRESSGVDKPSWVASSALFRRTSSGRDQFSHDHSHHNNLHRNSSHHHSQHSSKARNFLSKLTHKLTRSDSDMSLHTESSFMSEASADASSVYKASMRRQNSSESWDGEWDPEGHAFGIFSPDNKFRLLCRSIAFSQWFHRIMMAFIVISSITLALEPPRDASDPYSNSDKNRASYLAQFEVFFAILFTFEAVIKMMADGFLFAPHAYLRDLWNRIDFALLFITYLTMFFPTIRFLRMLRTIRPLRVVRTMPQLRVIVLALWNSLPAIFNVTLVSMFFYFLFGILGVSLFRGRYSYCTDSAILTRADCTGTFVNAVGVVCPRRWKNFRSSFDSIGSAILTLFQVASRNGWLEIMYHAMDITDRDSQPLLNNSPVNALFFVIFVIIGSFFVLNLFVGVIIEQINQQRGVAYLTHEQKQWVDTQRALLLLRPERRYMRPEHSQIRCFLYDLCRKPAFDHIINLCIILQIALLASEFSSMPSGLVTLTDIANNFFVIVFFVEALVKIIAFGPGSYLSEKSNVFDLVLVCGAMLSWVVSSFSQGLLASSFARLFRILRIFRLVRLSKGIRFLFETLLVSLPSILNISFLMFLLLYIYAVAGMQLFGNVKYQEEIGLNSNFRYFSSSLLLLWRLTTLDGWGAVMHECMLQAPYCTSTSTYSDCGSRWAWLFFLTFFILGSYIFLNLVIAVILDNFGHVYNQENFIPRTEHFEQFKQVWQMCDPFCRGSVPVYQVRRMLEELNIMGNPLGFDPHERRARYQTIYFEVESNMQKKKRRITFLKLIFILSKSCISEQALTYRERMERQKFTNVAVDFIASRTLNACIRGWLVRKHLAHMLPMEACLRLEEIRQHVHEFMIKQRKSRRSTLEDMILDPSLMIRVESIRVKRPMYKTVGPRQPEMFTSMVNRSKDSVSSPHPEGFDDLGMAEARVKVYEADGRELIEVEEEFQDDQSTSSFDDDEDEVLEVETVHDGQKKSD